MGSGPFRSQRRDLDGDKRLMTSDAGSMAFTNQERDLEGPRIYKSPGI